MPIQKLQRKVNQILLITMQKKGRWYISNRSKIWKTNHKKCTQWYNSQFSHWWILHQSSGMRCYAVW